MTLDTISPTVYAILVFMVSLSIRVGYIQETVASNVHVDLQIYRNCGKMVVNGVNPYDFNSKPEIRERLRAETDNDWLKRDMTQWNWYHSNNLPGTMIFLGSLEALKLNAVGYRLVFAFFDSLLAALVVFIGLKLGHGGSITDEHSISAKMSRRQRLTLLASLVSICAISPMFLRWSIFSVEEKGIQTLLMLGVICLASSKKRLYYLYLGSLVLGLSVAFKALGVILVPWYLLIVYREGAIAKSQFRDIIIAVVIIFVLGVLTAVPFMPEILYMIQNRLKNDVGGGAAYESIWVYLSNILPNGWRLVRAFWALVLVTSLAYGLYKRSIDLLFASISFLFIFLVIWITRSSPDRMLIGIIPLVLFLAAKDLRVYYLSCVIMFVVGANCLLRFRFNLPEMMEQKSILAIALMLSFAILYVVFRPKPALPATESGPMVGDPALSAGER